MNTEKKASTTSLASTVLMMVLVAFIFAAAFLRIANLMEARSQRRMEEGVETALNEVSQKLNRDSQILNAAAAILAGSDSFQADAMQDAIGSLAPLIETQRIYILLPDNTVIMPEGVQTEGSYDLDFRELAALGEHVSNRTTSVADGNTLVLRHYVPIVADGQTRAILYGVTRLADLPNVLNIDNIYNASADVYIVDMETSELIMDTRHEQLGDLDSFSVRRTRGTASWEEAKESIVSGEEGQVFLQSDHTGEWLYLYYVPAGINQWAVMISVPRSEAFANLFSVQRIILVMGVCIALVLLAYYLWMRRNARLATAEAVEKAVLKEKLQKAEAAERAKTMFLNNMSHDIRTPMNAIVGFATLAEANIGNRDRVQGYLAKIMSSSNHLLSLINDILDMSRIESGRLHIDEKPCSLSDIFKDMRNIIQTQMQSKDLNFFMDTIGVKDENICCDKLHINQVLLNLLSNAIKFTPPGGTVSLSVEQKPGAPAGYGTYEIRVKDTGIGMSPEFIQHVFEPFERERNSTASGIQGTGLGMAIAKSIVEAMGGTILVESEQGKGTEFIVTLDLRLQEEEDRELTVQRLTGLRSLVVDDSFSTCDSVTKMLAQIGMRAEWTLRGKEAVLHARQAVETGDPFAAYIIDWALPDLSGIEVARQIRAVAGANTPIIVLTAYDWSAFEEEARAAGVTAFCNKPIFLSELRDVLAAAVDESALPKKSEPVVPPVEEQLRGRRLLLVEDNELNREIAQELLEESGFAVETAENGALGVEKLKGSAHGYYDLVLMDIQMPVMDGYHATEAIRALDDPVLASIPIVAMTANAFEDDVKKALAAGMNAHLSKPINIDKVVKTLDAILTKGSGSSGQQG